MNWTNDQHRLRLGMVRAHRNDSRSERWIKLTETGPQGCGCRLRQKEKLLVMRDSFSERHGSFGDAACVLAAPRAAVPFGVSRTVEVTEQLDHPDPGPMSKPMECGKEDWDALSSEQRARGSGYPSLWVEMDCGIRTWSYSYLKAIMGSTRMARREGM